MILNNRAETSGIFTKNSLKILEDRWSIHCSPNSTGTTLKHTFRLDQDRIVENAAFIEDSKENLLYPIYIRRCSRFLGSHYDCKSIGKGDTVLEQYDPDKWTMYLTLLVAKNQELKSLECLEIGKPRIFYFRMFSICIMTGFVPVPSHTTDDYICMPTSTPKIDGMKNDIFPQKPNRSHSIAYLKAVLHSMQSSLADKFLPYLMLAEDGSPQIAALRALQTPVQREPSNWNTSISERLKGIGSR